MKPSAILEAIMLAISTFHLLHRDHLVCTCIIDSFIIRLYIQHHGWLLNKSKTFVNWSITIAFINNARQLRSGVTKSRYIQYSSWTTWYLHVCCRSNIVGWRLHHAFNVWTGICYIHARIRQIVWHVHPWMLHFFEWTFNETYNINNIYNYTWWTYEHCLYVFIDPWIHFTTEKLLTCSISHVLLFGRVWRMDLV